ncbi:metal ABC transporter substrate-binding protein [Dietzia sp. ANT_WB102]|uniref:metal ABC transporter substrate-binding protein n=1 Tax=Dietzia sp. ANT_WB102 TaxID=2597345 RepID=UPI0011EE7B28|nr:metal ABC transporter substrate-binding protein [Dietzia sp. ANT_WB102]KAA0916970.1 metal ABC transporter substrate-binding protein [Dietzia sp. ANT_WB102]
MPKLAFRSWRILASALTLPLVLSACGVVDPNSPEDDRPLVATTFTILADIASRIAGDRAVVESITQVGADIHQYEPTTGDLRRVAGADLLISNGLGVDDWLSRFFQSGAAYAVAAEGVDTLPIVSGEYVGKPNPHAWISPREGKTYVRNITAALTEMDPDGADEFARRAAEYDAELDALLARAEESIASLPANHRSLVTCEGAFSYLARDVGLEEHFLWAVNTEAQGTPQQVAALIDAVGDQQIPSVFCESTVSDTAMRQVARTTGARFGGTLYVDSLSEPDGDVPTYLALLEHDIDLITKGLTRS